CHDGKIHRDCWELVPPKQILATVKEWLDQVKSQTNRTPSVYTNRAWWMERIKNETDFSQLQGYPIWVAQYLGHGLKTTLINGKPRLPGEAKWALWQFTDGADFNHALKSGLRAADASIYKGSL